MGALAKTYGLEALNTIGPMRIGRLASGEALLVEDPDRGNVEELLRARIAAEAGVSLAAAEAFDVNRPSEVTPPLSDQGARERMLIRVGLEPEPWFASLADSERACLHSRNARAFRGFVTTNFRATTAPPPSHSPTGDAPATPGRAASKDRTPSARRVRTSAARAIAAHNPLVGDEPPVTAYTRFGPPAGPTIVTRRLAVRVDARDRARERLGLVLLLPLLAGVAWIATAATRALILLHAN